MQRDLYSMRRAALQMYIEKAKDVHNKWVVGSSDGEIFAIFYYLEYIKFS